MPRVRPRSNIYALLPVLATLIMAFGITVTILRINEYMGEVQAKPLPPLEGRKFPEPEALPAEAPVIEEGPAEELEDVLLEDEEVAPAEGEAAPAEGEGEAEAPAVEEAPAKKKAAELPAEEEEEEEK
jgi:hypothetical protein